MGTSRGMVSFVLHAHLPWVRAPLPGTLEERWFFEAMAEVYVPLLALLRSRSARGVATPVTVSLSPTLGAMMGDRLLATRFGLWLTEVDALLVRGLARFARDGALVAALEHHRAALEAVRAMWSPVQTGFVRALSDALRDAGAERWTTAYAHPYLPALWPESQWLAAHAVTEGLRVHAAQCGSPAAGLWLPECGWNPGLDPLLAASGVTRTVLESHAVLGASPRPRYATARPVVTPAGLVVLPRDPVTARAVWDRSVGYPGHPVYREFHRDFGAMLAIDDRGAFQGADGRALPTGVKPFAITDRAAGDKAVYVPEAARMQALRDADDFVQRCAQTLTFCAGRMSSVPPVLVAAFDAELFGHWWAEGLMWLDAALDGLVAAGIVPVTAGEATGAEGAALETVVPTASSWGEGGHGEVWLGGEGASLAQEVAQAARRVEALKNQHPEAPGTRRATRELLGMAASDWAFMLHGGGMAHYARERFARHRAAVYGFAHAVRSGHPVWSRTEPDFPCDDPPFVDDAPEAPPTIPRIPSEHLPS